MEASVRIVKDRKPESITRKRKVLEKERGEGLTARGEKRRWPNERVKARKSKECKSKTDEVPKG